MSIPERDYLSCFEDWKKRCTSVFYREGLTLKGMKLIRKNIVLKTNA